MTQNQDSNDLPDLLPNISERNFVYARGYLARKSRAVYEFIAVGIIVAVILCIIGLALYMEVRDINTDKWAPLFGLMIIIGGAISYYYVRRSYTVDGMFILGAHMNIIGFGRALIRVQSAINLDMQEIYYFDTPERYIVVQHSDGFLLLDEKLFRLDRIIELVGTLPQFHRVHCKTTPKWVYPFIHSFLTNRFRFKTLKVHTDKGIISFQDFLAQCEK